MSTTIHTDPDMNAVCDGKCARDECICPMTPPPDHPLLTKVLGDALRTKNGPQPTERFAGQLLAAIPPDIADRLEAALSCCQRPMDASRTGLLCMEPEGSCIHQHEAVFEDEHEPRDGCHPFVPLVEVP